MNDLSIRNALLDRQRDALRQFVPYQKQIDIASCTKTSGYVAVFAMNQCGKTLLAAHIAAMHATGHYSDWYIKNDGFVITDPGDIRVVSASPKTLQEGAFFKLFGAQGYVEIKAAWENKDKPWNGIIPRWAIQAIRRESNTDRVSYIVAKHKTGKEIKMDFMHTEKSITDFQSKTAIRFFWFDEGIPLRYLQESIPRQTHSPYGTKGIITMTPHLFAPIDLIEHIHRDPEVTWAGNSTVTISIDDVPDEIIPALRKEELIRNTSEREAPARLYGIPSGGGGLFFSMRPPEMRVSRQKLIQEMESGVFSVVHGMDFGFGLGDAMAFCALYTNVRTGESYLDKVFKEHKMTPSEFVNKLRSSGVDVTIPCSWPHDGMRGDKREDKKPYVQSFRDAGMNMLPKHVTKPNREADKCAIWWAMEERARNAKFFIVDGNGKFEDEWRGLTIGEDGTVKGHDHALDASYCAWQSRAAGRVIKRVDVLKQNADNIVEFPATAEARGSKSHLLW